MGFRERWNPENAIAAGLAATILLTLAALVLSIYSFRRIIASHDTLADKHAANLIAIQQLHFFAERKIAATRGFLLTGDQLHFDQAEEARKMFYQELDRMRERSTLSSERETLKSIAEAEASHQQVAEVFIAARKKQAWSTAMIVPFDERLRPLRIALDQNIETLQKVWRNQFALEQAQAKRLSSDLFRLLVGSSVALLAIFLVMGVLVHRFLRVRRQNEAELRKAHDELEQRVRERTAALSASNAELEAFSYSVSHDLRAPLRGIDGFSQALVEDYAGQLDETARKYLERIRAGTQKMGSLIDDLLTLSRLSRVEMQRRELDLSAMALAIANEMAGAEPQRDVQFAIKPGMTVVGDAGLLKAAMHNLISNAWKFTSDRPRARIEIGEEPKDGKRVFYVRDNGAGFDMAYSNKLFGAFQRLHKATEFPGTGVGLATVRRIIHRHGGQIWAEGSPDRGATFYFTLDAGVASMKAA